MTIRDSTDFLVIGSGIAGLAFARDLHRQGKTVRLLDKGRGVGGRVATRRWSDDLRVDHGAQFFTAKADRFRAFVDEWLNEPSSSLAVWAYGFPMWEAGRIVEREPRHPRYAPRRGMSELPRRLGTGLDTRTGITVQHITRAGDAWEITGLTADGETSVFFGRTLVLNLPPAQLLPLAGEFLPAETYNRLQAVEYDPTWTLLLRLEEDIPGADWPAIDCAVSDPPHPVLSWMARDHTKRGDPDAPPVLVAHGSGVWSREHLEDEPEAVQAALLAAVTEVTGPLKVRAAQVHRWRYAVAKNPYPAPFLFLSEHGILGCGDWCDVGGRVEGAVTSGWRLAEKIQEIV